MNNLTGKIYIGQTCDIYKRKSAHKREINKPTYISRSISKYGWSNHELSVLFYTENINIKDAGNLEIKFIKEYNSYAGSNKKGMNMTLGGECGMQTSSQIQKMVNSKFFSWKKKHGTKDM